MEELLSVSFGELVLKGKNRSRFVKKQEDQIHRALRGLDLEDEFYQNRKYFLKPAKKDMEEAIRRLRQVFGLIYVTPSLRVEKNEDLKAAGEACCKLVEKKKKEWEENYPGGRPMTFKVKVNRADKSFPIISPKIGAELGAMILEAFPDLEVKMKDPDLWVRVEVREDIFVSTDRYQGAGGLPAGTGGKGLLLLSGGIDSPVAGYEMARRGLSIGAMHFHAYPYTSERAKDKAIRLAKVMTRTVGPIKVFTINLLDTYKAAKLNCRERNITLLSRRMMMRVGNELCRRYGYQAMITGENLGQVASQTVEGMDVVNRVADPVILRPLVALDKTQIMDVARSIGTYEISIEPYEDSCSVFAPDQPNIRPRLKDIEAEEAKLDIEDLVDKALASIEVYDLD